MPEIKNTFIQGKMNKDLDERLIPNGQYRDALNIDVTSSEGSDAGAIENILGNTRVDTVIPEGYTCVGSISDETTNTLYWFVKGDDRDAILRFHKGDSFVVIVDAYESSGEKFLNFTGNHITGINIVDNFLFWTDGNSEPKKIDLNKQYQVSETNPLDEQTSASLFVNDTAVGNLQEQHITVIKKKPSIAPTVNINISANVLAVRSESIFEKIFPRFCFRYKYDSGEYSAFGPFTDVVFNPQMFGTNINQFNNYTTEEPYNRAMTNLIESIDLYDFVPSDIPEDVVQVDILYKQENSNVVYSVANIKSTDEEFTASGSQQLITGSEVTVSNHKGKYTISTENIHAALPESQLLRPWDNVPRSALAQEITGNRLVYGNYKQGYYLDEEPKLTAEYELRESQDFNYGGLRSVKSKRDYQVGVVLGDKYGRETPVFTSPGGSVKLEWNDTSLGQSLCSTSLMFTANLNSELPEWTDYYKFYVKQSSGEYYNLLTDKAYVPFKHVDFANKDEHVWLSMPSSDRNKLLEDDFIMLKKVYNGNTYQYVGYDNKFQVLDIENEAPDAVKFVFSNLGEVGNSSVGGQLNFLAGGADFLDNLFEDPNRRIDVETDIILINKTAWFGVNCNGSPLVIESSLAAGDTTAAETVKDIFISWENNGSHSDRYRVSSVSLSSGSTTNAGDYILKLSKKITSIDAALCEGTTPEFLSEDLKFNISRRDDRSTEDFSGKFFVKIKIDPSLIDIVSSGYMSDQVYVWSSHDANWLYDIHQSSEGEFNEQDGVVNSANSNLSPTTSPASNIEIVSNSMLNTAEEWDALVSGSDDAVGRTFFIDNLSFISSNPSQGGYAKEAGEGWRGVYTRYEPYNWQFNQNYIRTAGTSQSFFPASIIPDLEQGYYGWRYGTPSSTQSTESSGAVITSSNGVAYELAVENTTTGGYGLPPRAYVPSQDNTSGLDKIINGIEGFITSSNAHTDYYGPRRWLDTTLYTSNTTPQNLDTTYGSIGETGKFFMHLSFLAPGVDLHDGNFNGETGLQGVTLRGYTSIASKLQGVWGGGIFGSVPTAVIQDEQGAVLEASSNFDLAPFPLRRYIEFEGHYDETNKPQEAAPSPGIGFGYDQNYSEQHINQWNPAYGVNGIVNQEILEFVYNLKTIGSKFRFAGDPSGEIYEIKAVSEKHLYNHTSWRMRWMWNGTKYGLGANSVEEAASDWANTVVSDEGGSSVVADDLKQKIQDFGAAHNRRVCYIIELDKDPTSGGLWDPTSGQDGAPAISLTTSTKIEFISDVPPSIAGQLVTYPAAWETEPNQVSDLNIYYEASDSIPTDLLDGKDEVFAPVGCKVFVETTPNLTLGLTQIELIGQIHVANWSANDDGETFTLNIQPGLPAYDVNGDESDYTDATLKFVRTDGSYTVCKISNDPDGEIVNFTEIVDVKSTFIVEAQLDPTKPVGLSWYNCFSFGDGIESNRIRDGFNKMQITNGARASATLEEPYSEEMRKSGLIYSGIYNSNSGVNNLNQFIQAEKITKDLNPTYGSIQKLFSRNTDLVALCEDRVLKILANKDALFNADGNPQLIASSQVLGQAVPFVGDFGISKNPESFASESYRAYFSDKQRGAVLRLSMDGLTPISDAGMRDYFRDNLAPADNIIGSYDDYSKQYNITLTKHSEGTEQGDLNDTTDKTLSFSEDAKGWVSFKSFIPERGVSLSNQYFTMNKGELWQHNFDKDIHNRFYDVPYPSSVTAILNDSPSVIKNFNTINYEGSQASVEGYTTYMSGETQVSNLAPYNASDITGWEASEIYNSDESGFVTEFIEKEGKWFNYIKGGDIEDNSLQQTSKFSVQGLGIVKNEK